MEWVTALANQPAYQYPVATPAQQNAYALAGHLRGSQFKAGVGLSTVLPDIDFETYSEAGLVFNAQEGKWQSLPGLGAQQRGLKACGTRNYVQHPTFCVLSLAWNLKDGRGKRWWRPPELEDLFPHSQAPGYTPLDDLFEYVQTYRPGQDPDNTQGLLEAWNSAFEWQVWEFYCYQKLGWPKLHLEQMRCAMAKAKANGYPPGLDDTGRVLNLGIQKDPKGKALIRKLTMPRNPTKKNPTLRWTPRSAPQDFADFYRYNETDIATEAEASSHITDLDPFERRVWLMDQRVNMRGMAINRKRVEDCIAIVEQCRMKYHAELARITWGRVSKSTEVAETLRWLAEQGLHLGDLDEETVEETIPRTYPGTAIRRVLEIRQALAFGSVNKLYKMLAMITGEGRVYDQYSYAGAHTMLWNGRDIQMANLYRGMFDKPEKALAAFAVVATRSLEYVEYMYPDVAPLEIIASLLRSLIEAAPGHRFISADFTAIQAVVTSCLAREWWRIKVFQTHGKIYEATASQLTGKPLQFYLDYKKEQGKHHQDRQDYGKIPTLSADFGAWIGGWKKFGADKVIGDDAAIKDLILKTRARIPNIVELWGGQTRNRFNRAPDGSYAPEREELYGLEGAAIKAILSQDPHGGLGQAHEYNGCVYQCYGDAMYSAGPSGGLMVYHAPRLERSKKEWARPWELDISYEGWNTNANKGKQQDWIRMAFYGGVATQNIVARESRHVQACALLALDEHPTGNYPIVMHTHDENVAEVPHGRGSVAEYMTVMRGSLPACYVLPNGEPWPIKIPDAWECDFYGKWED